MARYTNPTEHIDRGLDLMRQLRTAQSGVQAATAAATAAPSHDGHCLVCKGPKTVFTEQVRATRQKGVQLHSGACGDCGTSVHRFVSKAKAKQGAA